jgi:hypothetical protein
METTNPTQNQVPPVPNDTSPRVYQLMQRLDRLPPGTYQLTIVKNDVRAMDWSGEIRNVELDRVERFSVSKSGTYNPE